MVTSPRDVTKFAFSPKRAESPIQNSAEPDGRAIPAVHIGDLVEALNVS